MKIMSKSITLINLINYAFKYVVDTSSLYAIDESHALKHSMEVYSFAKKIFESELIKLPYLKEQREIIYMSAIGHDMCDKKYIDETIGVKRYKNYLSEYMVDSDIEIIGKIIETMSYSKVKKNGFPNLGDHQLAYHIVREADLLAAYDIDRCIMYNMYRNNRNYSDSLNDAINLFDNRVFMMRKDRLFKTDYSKKESLRLHRKAKKDVECLREILNN
jgi:hypothetical protein